MADITTAQWYPNVTLTIVDDAGNAAAVDGVPVWASSDETILVATPAADGMSATINTVAAGTARVTVTADADLGAGTVTITAVTEDINVTPAPPPQASVMTLSLGTPEDKAPVVTPTTP